MARAGPGSPKRTLQIETLTHGDASRKNIPTAEYQAVMAADDRSPIEVAYERRNRDLDPQLVWRGKDAQDWSDLVVQAPPLFIQEKVHPKVLIDDLRRVGAAMQAPTSHPDYQPDLFADFNGLPSADARTEFYQHDANWSNRMILGDSLQVMASLAEREGLRGKVQCIYLDPPYGIKFNSNFQWSTTSRDVKDGNSAHITREPEQVKAFRDTWRDGIHSYLTYLRDRLTVARDLLAESGSIFVQIGDENVHRVRAVMDEVFGEEQLCAISFDLPFRKRQSGLGLQSITLHPWSKISCIWSCKDLDLTKFRNPVLFFKLVRTMAQKSLLQLGSERYVCVADTGALGDGNRLTVKRQPTENCPVVPECCRIYCRDQVTLHRQDQSSKQIRPFSGDISRKVIRTDAFRRTWKTRNGLFPVQPWKANRLRHVWSELVSLGKLVRLLMNFTSNQVYDNCGQTIGQISGTGSFSEKTEGLRGSDTGTKDRIQRCILMTTDPGDLVLDPTCGAGTTAYVAEQWGRRWITIDTSRVALALARARIMGARYPWYLLADSRDGQLKEEADIARKAPLPTGHWPTYNDIRHGFVYERVPHVTLKSIANNAEIDVIWEKWQETIQPLLAQLGAIVGATGAGMAPLPEWEIPRDLPDDWPPEAAPLHEQFWTARIARQRDIDASIAAKADSETLYDKPYEDNRKVRVAGPFTVESLSPHRLLGVDENDELIDTIAEDKLGYGGKPDFAGMILEHLKTAGVQQAHKDDRITFAALKPWPGHHVCAEGRYVEGDADTGAEKRAGIFIGPEFGTVSRPDLVEAVREAADAGFDVLIACAFNYDAHASEFNKLGRVPILKARMNADLHMAADLKNTGHGNLFVIFGEPDTVLK